MSKEFTVTFHSASVKNHGNLYLSVQNLTDSSQTYQVRARHLDSLLTFSPEKQQIQVAPRGTSEVSIAVSVRNRRVWQPAEYDFDILVGTVEVQDQLRGHLSVTPPPLFWLALNYNPLCAASRGRHRSIFYLGATYCQKSIVNGRVVKHSTTASNRGSRSRCRLNRNTNPTSPK